MFKILIIVVLTSMLILEVSPGDIEQMCFELAERLEPLIEVGSKLWNELSQKNIA